MPNYLPLLSYNKISPRSPDSCKNSRDKNDILKMSINQSGEMTTFPSRDPANLWLVTLTTKESVISLKNCPNPKLENDLRNF